MTSEKTSPLVVHADKEHAGIRIVVMAVIILATVGAFFLFLSIFNASSNRLVASYYFPLSCITALPVAFGLAAATEYWLKLTWHSGRKLTLDGETLEAYLGDDRQIPIVWSRRFSVLIWHFSLKDYPRGGRERRVPAGWYCLAYQIQQDSERFIVFCFMPPRQATIWMEEHDSHEIRPAEYHQRSFLRRWISTPDRPTLPTSALAGKDGPYWMAERRRWNEGLELTKKDFLTFTKAVYDHLAG